MSAHDDPESIRKEVKIYITVFVGLAVLTVLTVAVSYFHMPVALAILVALAIATFKGSLVAAVFMHLRAERKLIYWVLVLTVIFFIVLMAIPSLSQSKQAAWELAKFLCAPEQVLEDAHSSGFVEVSRNSVLNDPAFVARFRPELVATTVASRAFARGERPVTRFGMEVGNMIGDEIVRVLTGELTAKEAMQIAEQRVGALGTPG